MKLQDEKLFRQQAYVDGAWVDALNRGTMREKIGDLIERVKNLNAHDDERCDHQIETKMHVDLEPNIYLRPPQFCGRPGAKLNTHW